MRLNIRTFMLIISALSGVAAFQSSAFGQCDEHNYYWVAGFGDWSTPENWRHQVTNPDPNGPPCKNVNGVPSSDDYAHIDNGGTALIGAFSAQSYDLWVGFSSLGAITQIGGICTVGGSFILGHEPSGNGFYNLRSGNLGAGLETIGYRGTGMFVQEDGKNTVETGFSLGDAVGGNGTYNLDGGTLSAYYETVGEDGIGLFRQGGGTNSVNYLHVGLYLGSSGTYELGDGSLSAFTEPIGCRGTGIFRQSGGTNTIQDGLVIGQLSTGNGTYELSNGNLSAGHEAIGYQGIGTFTQSGGTNTVVQNLIVGMEPNSVGRYELLGGTLNIQYADIGEKGTGSFVMDGGVVNGTADDSELRVHGSKGTLTGPGTFNIKVVYESDEIYGTYGDVGVAISFLPNCLTQGGAFSVAQIIPADFAGGNVSNLLESSVFDVSFDGSFCSEFTITIPYVQAEVNALGVDETSLIILHETGPGTYERLDDITVDAGYDIVSAKAHTFGKFAVQAKVPWILVHGWNAGPEKWIAFEMFLEKNNIPYDVVDLRPDANPNERARRLAQEIELIRQENQWFGKINLICHSQGGLDARAYVWNMGQKANVDTIVMIGTPNHGTWLGWPESILCLLQSEPPPMWLTPLWVERFNKSTGFIEGVNYFWIAGSKKNSNWLLWGEDDGVVPVSSVILNGANSLGKFPYEHNQLLTETSVFEAIRKQIDPPYVPEVQPVGLIKMAKGHVEPSQTIVDTVLIDDLSEAAFVVLSDSALAFNLMSPIGQLLTPQTEDPNISYFVDDTLRSLQYSYVVKNPSSGIWTAQVGESPGACDFIFLVVGDTTVILNASTDKYVYGSDETVTIGAELVGGGTITKMDAHITKPDLSEDVVHLFDDGSHKDGAANDGLYGNIINPDIEGAYYLVVSAEGDIDTKKFSRSAVVGFLVVSNYLSVRNVIDDEVLDTNSNGLYDKLIIKVIVKADEAGLYSVYGILRKNKKEVAHSLPLSTEISSGEQVVEITFAGKDIYSSHVNGPYSLDIVFTDDEGNLVGGGDDVYLSSSYFYAQFEHAGEQPSPELEGDINRDSKVDFYDFAFLAEQWTQTQCSEPNWCSETDLDYSGDVGFTDLMTIAQNWLKVIPTTGDLNFDWTVNLNDFSLLATQWNQTGCQNEYDCYGADLAPNIRDGIVNELDLAVLAEHWLEGAAP